MLASEHPRKNLLLISSSTIYSRGYLDHVEGDIRELLRDVRRIAFVPFALYDRDTYAAKVRERFHRMGFALESVHSASSPKQLIEKADAIFIGGGNTFRLLKALYDDDLLDSIRSRVEKRSPFHRVKRRFDCRVPDPENNERHACRPTSLI